MSNKYVAGPRDRVVNALANWMIRTFGSKKYVTYLAVLYSLGSASLSLDLEAQDLINREDKGGSR